MKALTTSSIYIKSLNLSKDPVISITSLFLIKLINIPTIP